MKVLALNGSPRGTESNTDRLLQPLLAGAAEAGASVQTLYAAKLKVADCIGCFGCWTKTPGQCVLEDDMTMVLQEYQAADLVIWATPLYYYGMTARLKRIMERLLPLNLPYIEKRGNHYTHPPRYPERRGKVLLLANCGFPERHHFNALEQQFRQMDHQEQVFVGSIFCTAGEFLRYLPIPWYRQALREAGKQLVTDGCIAEATQAVLNRDFVDIQTFLQYANASWEAADVAVQPGGKE